MSIDFEFNNMIISMIQIKFNIYDKVIVFDPSKLDQKTLLYFIHNYLSNRLIKKILHGSESLDIPYLFNQILITPDNINNFCSNFYDTKYLCEYYQKVNNIKGKCSIYNLLLDFNIVTQEKITELENIENITGPIYLITMDIYKLNHDVLRYSLYDVIYLAELIKKFLSMDIVYTKIIPEVSCLVSKYKRAIENQFNDLVVIINSLNICYIYDNNDRIILKDIWDLYYYTISDNNNYLYDLREINYFKSFFEIITKCVVYSNIIKYFKVHKNKNELCDKIDFNIYFDWLHTYSYINNVIIEYNKNVINDLNKRMYKL
jgi:hypothetical protein